MAKQNKPYWLNEEFEEKESYPWQDCDEDNENADTYPWDEGEEYNDDDL